MVGTDGEAVAKGFKETVIVVGGDGAGEGGGSGDAVKIMVVYPEQCSTILAPGKPKLHERRELFLPELQMLINFVITLNAEDKFFFFFWNIQQISSQEKPPNNLIENIQNQVTVAQATKSK